MARKLYLLLFCSLVCLTAPAQFAPFRFALLTDIHISRTNNGPLEDLANSVAEINATDSIAFVIVSGDITDSGDKESMERAKAELDRLSVPYYVTSGNHETKWSESGCTDFAKVFGSDRFAFTYNGCCFIGFNSGPVIKMADGHVAPQDILWLSAQLGQLPQGTYVFPVTHYPLQTGDVDNWYDVTDVLRRYPIQAVLGGHYHRNLLFNCDGIPDVLCRSNLRAKAASGGWSQIRVDADSVRFFEKRIGQAPQQWLSLPFGEHEYGAPDSSLRPDYTVNTRYAGVREMWQTDLHVGLYSAPVVSGGRVFIGDDEGTFYGLDVADGHILWTFRTGSRIASTACVAEGRVIVGSTDGGIYCLGATDGALLWKVQTDKAVMGCPVTDGEKVYIGGSDGCFRALSLTDGAEIWCFAGLQGYVETRPCLYEGKIYFGAWDCRLYALQCADGSLVWKWSNGRTNDKYSPAAVWPVAADGKVFITAPDRYFTALDAQTGKIVWRTNGHMVRETVGLSEDATRVFSRCMNDSVVAMDASATEPVTLWTVNAAYGYDHNPSMLIEKEGVVVFGTKNGLLHGLDAQTGDVLWRHKIGNSVLNTVWMEHADDCIVSSSEGTVTRVRISD